MCHRRFEFELPDAPGSRLATRGLAFLVAAVVVVSWFGCAPSSRSTTSSSPSSPSRSTPPDVQAPDLRLELLKMFRDAKIIRRRLAKVEPSASPPMKLIRRMRNMDREHARRLRAIIERRGRWPGRSLVGRMGSQAAFAIARYADFSTELQAYFLTHLQRAAEHDEASTRQYAYLADRVRLDQGRKQLYGTQLSVRDGRVEPEPLADPDTLAERRRKMGLMPFEEYVERFERKYNISSSSRE